jgi:hypothetical protein
MTKKQDRPDLTTRLWNWGLSRFAAGPTHFNRTLKMSEAKGARWLSAPIHVRAIADQVEMTIERQEAASVVMSINEVRELVEALVAAAGASEAYAKDQKASV